MHGHTENILQAQLRGKQPFACFPRENVSYCKRKIWPLMCPAVIQSYSAN